MKRRLGVTGPERLFIRVVGQRPGNEQRRLVVRERDPLDGRVYCGALGLTCVRRRVSYRRAG